ncbi:MAG: peptide deformylase [Oscillospiraceae bacterium]|nr:peptide deformylase [Oscillospiraceae bacterium]
MAILKIIKEGSQDLRKKSRPVEKINRRIITLLDDMRETLKDAEGIGLAAPQVGVLRRVVVIETEDGELLELINPEIIYREGEQEEIEGCLSSPGKYAQTIRPAVVKVSYLNRNGETVEKEGTELLARAFCHETDHLDGVLCFDKAVRILTREELDELREKENNEKNGQEKKTNS